MSNEPEFVRGNQKSYIRIKVGEAVQEGYAYRMFVYNVPDRMLHVQPRMQNGTCYMYYEISGMQSFDIFLQTQKLRRKTAEGMARSILQLCKELEEYALDIRCVVFEPKFVMVEADAALRFLYVFGAEPEKANGLEQFLEYCVEYLDYKDETLMKEIYGIYERLLDQGEQFLLQKEMEQLLGKLCEEEKPQEEGLREEVPYEEKTPEDIFETEAIEIPVYSKAAQKDYKRLKIGLLMLIGLDVAAFFLWKPLTLLKIFFFTATLAVLVWLRFFMFRQGEKVQECQAEQEEHSAEWVQPAYFGAEDDCTRIIMRKDTEKFLVSMQGIEPQCIYFSDVASIIGKERSKVQVCIEQEGISRVHARIVREGETYKIEDLNATNGTWVNGEALVPRTVYCLKEGDKVRFAETEYIFR